MHVTEEVGNLRKVANMARFREYIYFLESSLSRVSVQGVESLWGDCRFIPAD